jgi:hypothetical protein
VVKNRDAFVQRYGNGLPVAGEYDGNLSNGGENLLLVDIGRQVLDVTYGTDAPWPANADGAGSSLELLDWSRDFNSPTNWQASAETGGTPGRIPGAVPRIDSIRLEGQRVILQFTARVGAPYTLWFKPELDALTWIPLSQLPPAPAAGSRQFEEPLSTTTQQSFYRISSP